jgi:hypothetical protein
MSAAHKAALAAGRDDGRAVKAFLEALEVASAPRPRGRPRTRASVENRLKAIENELKSATALARLHLVQERRDLRAELERLARPTEADMRALRQKFVAVAKRYSERKGISYAAWREVGVDAATLRAARIAR